MKSPKRALLYGLGVWAGLVAISLILLPAEGKHEAFYESIKLSAMVGVALGFAIAYLGRQNGASTREGAFVGLGWAVICVLLDLALFAAGAFNISLATYFADVASSYLVMPIITTLTMGYLRRTDRRPDPRTQPTPAADPAGPASG